MCVQIKVAKNKIVTKYYITRASHKGGNCIQSSNMFLCCNRPEGFWDTMYSDMGGKEFVHSSALGVLILWFAW